MNTKEIYKSPQTEVLPVAVEVNIMSNPGGAPDYTYHDPSGIAWE